jgi:subtilisin family serine protease
MALTFLCLLAAPALAAPATADPDLARLTRPLQAAAMLGDWESRVRWARVRPGSPGGNTLQVVVELEPWALASQVADDALWLHPEVTLQVERSDALQLLVPYEALLALPALDGVKRVREPYFARARATSEGVDEILFLDWHADGYTGLDVRVAILDIGFAGWTNVGDDEIPSSQVTDATTDGWQQSDHGTAVTEIVHDMAPDASLGLFNFQTDQEYVDRMEEIVNDGWHVINASIGFDNVWHADGTSPYSQTVDWAADNGVVYVAAAGNEGFNYVSGDLTDKLDDEGASQSDGWAEINGNNGIWIPVAGGVAEASLRWTDVMGASNNDFDLFLFYDDTSTEADNLCGSSEEPQAGLENPYEFASCESTGSWVYARVAFQAAQGQEFPANREAFLYCFYGVDENAATSARTLTLPADAAGAISVGAYRSTGDLAWYSSQGPTEDGRTKPDLVAPTAVTTKIYGTRAATEGTSFSAPHVSGAVALVLDVNKRMTPQEVKDFLRDNADDLGPEGPDDLYGWGAVKLSEKPEGCGCNAVQAPGHGLAVLLPLWMAGLRRRG